MRNNFYYKNNRLQQLRGFCYTVQLGSVSKAAAKMGLQQCSVSTQIKSLEEDLNLCLFNRHGPNLNITPEGVTLYDMVLPHIEMMDSLPARFQKKLRDKLSESLVLAANQVSMTYLMPDLISACKATFPDIRTHIKMKNPQEALDLLRKDEIQAYIGPAFSRLTADFAFQEIGNYEVILIAHKNHPLITEKDFHLTDLGKYKSVLTSDRRFISVPFFEELLEQYDVDVYAEIENVDWEILKSFVARTDTFTIVSNLCYDSVRDYMVGRRSLKDFIPNMSYGITTKKDKFHTAPIVTLLKTAQSMLKQTL